MKKILIIMLACCLMLMCAACTEDNSGNDNTPTAGTQISITVGTKSFTATLADNETVEAFKEKLPLTLDMSELNGNEKYNYLSENLPSNSSRAGTIQAGDIMLYGYNCVVLFYETFSSSYSYTRIGWVNDTTGLKAALGQGSVTVIFSAETTGNGNNETKQPEEGEQPSDTEKPSDTEQPSDTEKPNESKQNFVYKKEGNAYTVTGFTGEETEITVPAEYDGLHVTKIQGDYGTGAFARKDIMAVTIPDSITEIGQNSFHNCSQLESVKISENSKLIKIGNNAFSGNSALKSIYIPAGMVELGDSVFNNCGALENIMVAAENTVYRSENGHLIERSTQTLIRGSNNSEIPDGVKSIAQAAFRRVNGIERLRVPKSVESIANYIIADSSIASIDYEGTEEEWNEITKSKMWNYGKENLQITFAQNAPVEDEKEITVMYLYINVNKLEVTLADNVAVAALIDILKQGDITYTANDYGGFEKVGFLGHSLPTDNSQITTEAGDVILYSENQIVLFYGSNSWVYTKLGKINGHSVSELRTLLGAGNGSVQVRISLK